LPFAIGSNVTLPRNYFKKHRRATKPLDFTTKSDEWSLKFSSPKKRGWEQLPVKEIVDRLQNSSGNPIDLTVDEDAKAFSEAVKMARRTSVKFISFSENVRPAYFGTYTPSLSLASLRKLARNPKMRIDHLNYDYDSEAEWEEEEGDDVASDGEEEEEDLVEDDDEAFIDDAETAMARARGPQMFMSDLVPVCTGIQWQDGQGGLISADGITPSIDLGELEIEFLIRELFRRSYSFLTLKGPTPHSIDPFSTVYWETTDSSPSKLTAAVPGHRPALMDKTKQLNSVTGPNSSKAARYVPDSDLPAFKEAIDGQDLTKIAMIEHLKKL
jgi:chromatin assembly factor 1 subunit A